MTHGATLLDRPYSAATGTDEECLTPCWRRATCHRRWTATGASPTAGAPQIAASGFAEPQVFSAILVIIATSIMRSAALLQLSQRG